MDHQTLGIVAAGAITTILGGLALYGFIKKKLPLRTGGYVTQADEPIRFRVWISVFTVGAGFSAAALLSLVRHLFE